ncbi:hypothetical protein HHK36_023672 [Tetracentron sinense]|uniref:Uncharacterized protein n=1 Tax=Tetracentron sinense TaxID=13715 RepID=A0A835D5F5_TETSI|nr:hypothetical protein HHK36_023672 [Tetracentron sinense]
METLISDNFPRYMNTPYSLNLSPFNSRSSALKNRILLHFSNRKWCWVSKKPNFCSISALSSSNSTNYGGWNDLESIDDSNQSGKLDQFQNFLVSVGIDDRKHVFMFLLGLVSALAISRIRVSSIIVFPASVLVFAVGFSLGFVRGGSTAISMKEISINGSKKTPKEKNPRFSDEKLKNMVDVFSEFDVKITNLKNDMKGAIDSNRFEMSELESYLEVIKSMSLSVLPAKNALEASVNSMDLLVEDQEVERNSNQKPSRRRKEMGANGFDFFQIIGWMFQENSVGLKPNKVKDPKEPLNLKAMSDQTQGSILVPAVEEEKILNTVPNDNIRNVKMGSCPQEASNNPALNPDGCETLGDGAKNMEIIPKMVKATEMDRSFKRLPNTEEVSHPNNSLPFLNNHGIFLKLGHQNENETEASLDSLIDPANLRLGEIEFDSLGMEAEESISQKRTLKTSNGTYIPSHRGKGENGAYRPYFIDESIKSEDQPYIDNQISECDSDVASTSSSLISDDVVFDRHVTQATYLIKQAKEFLRGKGDEERAEIMLHKSARLLSKATTMKPMSLLAVGQLGNTYLLHGELKLKISRELRTFLSRRDPLSAKKRSRVYVKGLDDQVMSKDRIASVLVDVCEECEELLVDAGRKYRMALSIDANDVRALYNWGLALSFRAQLIADIGPEAAFDADKVYLAAIDKFDAMMSKSNIHAHDALFRWGVALQKRSHLQPSNSKKMKLLQQAKRLYEDALIMDSDNLQVREALSSCISELDFRNF